MPLALCLMVLFVFSGTSLTYLYYSQSSILGRLAVGAATGPAALGLIGLSIALVCGLGPACIILSAIISALGFLVFLSKRLRHKASSDILEGCRLAGRILRVSSAQETAEAFAYLGLIAVLFLVFKNAMFHSDGAAFTGVQNNYGDLMLHLSVIARFGKGGNFPPVDPAYAGAKFTYPFLTDFIAAMFFRAGASFQAAMFLEGFALASATLVLLHRWVLALTGNRAACLIAELLVFFSGGLGWVTFVREAAHSSSSLSQLLVHLPHDYTITAVTFRWANSLTSLLVPQRSLLLGVPLALVAFHIFWQNWRGDDGSASPAGKAEETKSSIRAQGVEEPVREAQVDRDAMIAAGLISGILPLAHTHTFLVVTGVAFILALLDRQRGGWAWFFASSLLVALPQLWWLSLENKVRFENFFQFHTGWDGGGTNLLWFWLANTGAFIPLLLAALFWRGKRLVTNRHRLFYLPFALCFVIPNLVKLAPWEWDNIKVLFYWFLGSVPLVAAVLAWIWNRNLVSRVIVLALVFSLTFGGALDVWRVVSGASQFVELTKDDLEFASLVERATSPDALILHAPIHNDPILLTGRQSFIGYPGHLWTRGIDPYPRVETVSAIYAGGPEAEDLISESGIQYAVVSRAEESTMPVNADFFARFDRVVHIGSYSLYKLR